MSVASAAAVWGGGGMGTMADVTNAGTYQSPIARAAE